MSGKISFFQLPGGKLWKISFYSVMATYSNILVISLLFQRSVSALVSLNMTAAPGLAANIKENCE